MKDQKKIDGFYQILLRCLTVLYKTKGVSEQMKNKSFNKWLKAIKKYDQGTCNSRISNCMRIEKFYGDLDEIYNKDKCEKLKMELNYSMEEFRKNIPPKHRIPIDGDAYNGTATLRSALNLYLEFKDNEILRDIMTMEDVIPDKHDGSYELVRETVESLSKMDPQKIDIPELDLLYIMAVGLFNSKVERRLKKIEESNLPLDEKNRLKTILDNVVEKAKNYGYENRDKNEWTIGMVGTGFYTFNRNSDKENAQKFISLCIRIKDLNDEEEILTTAEEALKNGIKGMQAVSASIVLHCLKPNIFPIINNAMIKSAFLLESQGVILNKPSQLTTYIENARKIKKFRDEKCKFKNYRALDLKLWELEESKNEIQYSEPIDISKEQWIEMLLNPDIFRDENIRLVKMIYEKGGQATASELAETESKHPSSYNAEVVALSKRIQHYTNCIVPKREDGTERWWHVLFNGSYKDDRTFNWILRPELKETIMEKYYENKVESKNKEEVIDNSTNYWWLNANPQIWSFSDLEIGGTIDYTSRNEREIKERYIKILKA